MYLSEVLSREAGRRRLLDWLPRRNLGRDDLLNQIIIIIIIIIIIFFFFFFITFIFIQDLCNGAGPIELI